jgi:hypothetical protein
MTEADWNSCTEPRRMLEALRESGEASERKLRLFTAACCRRIWHRLRDVRSREAVEVAERFADGLASGPELEEASTQAAPAYSNGPLTDYAGRVAAWVACSEDPALAALDAEDWAARAAAGDEERSPAWLAAFTAEQRVHCQLLRCICGPVLFRPLPPVAPAVLAWNGGTVGRLAAGVYEERDFTQGRLGVLADAAEEAGLEDAEILAHLRSPGPHARGCWGVDLLLGRA